MSSIREKLLSHDGTLTELVKGLQEAASALAAEQKAFDGLFSGNAAPRFLDVAEIRVNLLAFYQEHNAERVQDVPKILEHFDGRFHALNEALVMTYGCGIDVADKKEEDDVEGGGTHVDRSRLMQLVYEHEKKQRLVDAVVLERHLPGKHFGIRFGGEDLVGMEQFWLHKLSGLLRVDLFSSSRKGNARRGSTKRAVRPTVQLCISTVKPLRFHLHISGLRIVQKSRATRPTVHNFRKLVVHGEVEVYALFLYRNPSGSGSKSKRWQLSPLSKVVITKLKTHMLSVADKLLQTVLNGILPSTILNAVLEVLPDELGRMLNGTDTKRDNHKQGLAVEVELQLRGSPSEAEFHRDLCVATKGLSALGFESSQQVSLLRDCLVKLKLHEGIELCLGDLLPLRKKLLGQDIKEMMKTCCENKRVSAWVAENIAAKLEEVAEMKVNVELTVKGLDLKMEVDRSVSMLREFLWRTRRSPTTTTSLNTRARVEEDLKSIHRLHHILTLVLTTIKELSERTKLVLTGSASGGKYPVYELCLRDLVVNGALDLSIVNCRLGGSLQELLGWIERIMGRIEATPEQRAQMSSAVDLMHNVDFIQFFLDIEVLHLASKHESNSDTPEGPLLLTINGQRDNPRPPLTIHVVVSAREVLRHLDGASVGGTAPQVASLATEFLEGLKMRLRFSFPASGVELQSVLAEELPHENGLQLALCMLGQWKTVSEGWFDEIVRLSFEISVLVAEDDHDRESVATTLDSDQSTSGKPKAKGRESVCTLDTASTDEER